MIRLTLRSVLSYSFLLVPLLGFAQEVEVTPTLAPTAPAAKPKPFTLDQVVNERVSRMAVPEMRPGMVGVKMAVSSPSEKARAHVKQGFALVHAQWDFEAYRHFCAALVEDPDCLLAYCGVSLALAKPYNEYWQYRLAAISRMQDLMEADDKRVKEGKVGRYPVVEKKFAYALAKLFAESPHAAGVILTKMGEEYPNLLQAQLLGVFLTRGGYDVLGDPTPEQQRAIKRTRELMKANPGNPMVLGFWLSLNAEVPHEAMNLKKEVLPYTRYLARKCPRVPSWQHMLGHYEWRAGNYLLAERAFTRAADLYSKWMKREGVGTNDCEGYVRSKLYLANTHYQRGNFLSAMKIAKELRAMKPDPARPMSPGSQILLWRAYTLPARLYMAHGAKGDMDRALKSFPDKKELKPYVENPGKPTLAGAYIEALSVYIGVRKAIEASDIAAATALHRGTFRRYIMNLAKVVDGARRSSDYSHYISAGSSLAVLDMELIGLISLNGPKDGRVTASNWFRSARDKQGVASLMMPPSVLTPMENRLGECYLRYGKPTMALEAYQAGEKRNPNNIDSLRGIKRCLDKLGRKEAAAVVQKQIELVKNMK